MAELSGTNLAGSIVPFTTEDTFATHLAKFGKGGWRSVTDTAERDGITADRREAGMAVYVIAEKKLYILADDLTSWTELDTDSGYTKDEIDGLLATIEAQITAQTALIDGKADKTDIPTQVSQLENDSGYITQANLEGLGLPDQTGNNGKFLMTDGSATSWEKALKNNATGENYIAVGKDAYTYEEETYGNGVAIGSTAKAWALGGTVVGAFAEANVQGGVAIGENAKVNNFDATTTDDSKGVAVGTDAQSTNAQAISIGGDSVSSGVKSIAIGSSAVATADGAIQLGEGTNSTADTLQFKDKTIIKGDGTVPYERLSTATPTAGQVLKYDGDSDSLVWGAGGGGELPDNVLVNSATTDNSLIVGTDLQQYGGNLIVGPGSKVTGFGIGNTVVGLGAYSRNYDATSIGNGAVVEGQWATAVGYGANAKSNAGVAVGALARADSNDGIAIGHSAVAEVMSSIAIGRYAEANADDNPEGAMQQDSIAIGSSASSTAEKAIAFGVSASANSTQAIAIGSSAVAEADGAIQLGEGTNNTADTLQFKDKTIIKEDGTIPPERLSPESPAEGFTLVYDSQAGALRWAKAGGDETAGTEVIIRRWN